MKYARKFGKELEKVLQKASKKSRLLHEFLDDLLTPPEYQDLAVRWQIVKQLNKKVPQRKIAKNLGVSIATVSRGSREMLNKKGGFAKMIKAKK